MRIVVKKRGNRTEITIGCQGNVFPVDSFDKCQYILLNSMTCSTDSAWLLIELLVAGKPSIRGFSSVGLKTAGSERPESRDRQVFQCE